MPSGFDIEGGLALALVRGLFVAGLLGAFGTMLFGVLVAPRALAGAEPAVAARETRRLRRLARLEMAAALLLLAVWLVAQGADMASATDPAAALAAVPTVLAATEFGHIVLLQAVLLIAAWLASRYAPIITTLLLGLATALQAGHGHVWTMDSRPTLLLAFGIVHLLAAAGWLGGLLPLLLMARDAPPRIGAMAARWFSPLGKWCLGGMVASAAWQFWELIGGLPGLVGTAYGWVAGVKLALLGVLFGFALLNRYRLAPALLRAQPDRAQHRLVVSIAVQSGFGLLTVLAAGLLSNLPPAMHLQPIWPFAQRFSLDTVREDAGFRDEVIGAALALAGAVLAAVAALLLRRRLRPGLRWAVLLPVAGAAAIAWFAVPHLGLLLVDAYPTSYYRSPTGFAAASIAEGAGLFPQNCAICHGEAGRGDGPAARSLPVPPADLTATHLWMHSDGELFWWLTNGIEAPEGGPAMPGFGGTLSPEQRWALIDYIRAHNAGLAAHAAGSWTPPLPAPSFQASCANGSTVSLADLRGGFVRIVVGDAAPAAVPGVTTILIGADPSPHAQDHACASADENVPLAYAIIAGVAPGALPGTQFLVDGAGWLRAVQRPGDQAGWNDPQRLLADIRRFRAHPLAAGAGMDHADMQM